MKAKPILWISFFINAASFFFTLRLRNALALFGVFLAVGLIGNYLMVIEFFSQPVEFCFVILFLFLPVVLNGLFLTIHESNLKHQHSSKKENVLELASDIKDLIS